jgi:hypothetical protein
MLAFVCLVALTACQQSQEEAASEKRLTCKMPADKDPQDAASAALLRGDYRVMMHYSNGESPHSWPLGIEYAGRAGKLDPLWSSYKISGHQCGYEIDISEGEIPANSVDQPAPFTRCGEKQYAYAAAYNRQIISSSQFKKMCGAYRPDGVVLK